MNQRQSKELDVAKLKKKMAMDNILSAQKHLNDKLQLSLYKERLQMLQELQALREENQVLTTKVQKLKTKRVEEPMVPKPVQELHYQYVPVGLHNIFIVYQKDEEEEDIDEMDQPLHDQPPSPLNDPYEESEDQPAEERPDLTWQTLKERLQERITHEADPKLKANLQWDLHVVELAEQRFLQIDQIYEAHRLDRTPSQHDED